MFCPSLTMSARALTNSYTLRGIVNSLHSYSARWSLALFPLLCVWSICLLHFLLSLRVACITCFNRFLLLTCFFLFFFICICKFTLAQLAGWPLAAGRYFGLHVSVCQACRLAKSVKHIAELLILFILLYCFIFFLTFFLK